MLTWFVPIVDDDNSDDEVEDSNDAVDEPMRFEVV
jgi:hypothetical protein